MNQLATTQPNGNVPLSHVMDLLLDAICMVDTDGRFVFVSAAFERIFGYTASEVIGQPMIELVYPDDRERTLQAAAEIMAGQPKPNFQNRHVRKDGQIVHIMWSAHWSNDYGVQISVARDITELKHAESMQAALYAISEATHSAEDLPTLFRQIHQIIGKLLPARNFFVALHDKKRNELSFPYFVDEYDEPPAPRPLDSSTLSAEVIRSGEALLLTPDTQHALPEHIGPITGRDSLDWLGVPLTTQRGTTGVLVVQSYSGDVRYTEKDKTLLQFVSTQIAAVIERKQAETWLHYVALHDPLTALPNRALFHERLRNALDTMPRQHSQLALLYIDLDKFKCINDSYGHDIGDLLLREVADRIRHCVRESDTVGRVGGDEFVILLNGISQPEHINVIAEKIRTELSRPIDLSGQQLHISASIGIATPLTHEHTERDDEHWQQLMRRADDAMYAAKRQGGNQLIVAADPANAGDDRKPA